MSDASFQQRAQHLAAANSFLFVGGDSEHRLRKALESPAHVVIADLEDAVHPHRKQVARETLARVLGRQSRRRGLVAVRINQVGTPESGPDQDLIAELAVDGLVLPKASPTMMPLRLSHPLIPIVETAYGLRLAYEVARLAEVVRLMLGTVDLGVELGLGALPQSDELLHARSRLVLDSAAAGVAAPIDGVRLDVRDQTRLRTEAARSKALGFSAKACVHPAQIPTVNQVFAPTSREIAWARKVDDGFRAAHEQGRGVVLVGGEMVDAPIARRARAILAEATRGD